MTTMTLRMPPAPGLGFLLGKVGGDLVASARRNEGRPVTVGDVDLSSLDFASPFSLDFTERDFARAVHRLQHFLSEAQTAFPLWLIDPEIDPTTSVVRVYVDPTPTTASERFFKALGR